VKSLRARRSFQCTVGTADASRTATWYWWVVQCAAAAVQMTAWGSERANRGVADSAVSSASLIRRWVKNDRHHHAGYLWAFSALRHSPGAGAHYRRRREQGDWHTAAQRNLFNRMIGQLYHCLQQGRTYDEALAFGPAPAIAAANAA
jgi:hypothetical protein